MTVLNTREQTTPRDTTFSTDAPTGVGTKPHITLKQKTSVGRFLFWSRVWIRVSHCGMKWYIMDMWWEIVVNYVKVVLISIEFNPRSQSHVNWRVHTQYRCQETAVLTFTVEEGTW